MKNSVIVVACMFFVACTASRGPATFVYLRHFAVVKAECDSDLAALPHPVSPVLHVEKRMPAKVRLANQKQYEAEQKQYVVDELSFLRQEDALLAATQRKIAEMDSRGADEHSVRAVQMYSSVLGDQRKVGIHFKRIVEFSQEMESDKRGAEGKVLISGIFAILGPNPANTSAFLKNVGTAIQESGDQNTELHHKLEELKESVSSKLSHEADCATFRSQMITDFKNKYPSEKWEEIGSL